MPKTKQDVVQQRIVMLEHADEMTAKQLHAIEQQGCSVEDQTLVVTFRYDRNLSVWCFQELQVNNTLNINQPLNRLSAVYKVDPSFYDKDQLVDPDMEEGLGGWKLGSDVTLTKEVPDAE